MKVSVDRTKCEGHAVCFAQAPGVYQLDELGYNAIDGVVEMDERFRAEAELGARACPERAITVLADGDPGGAGEETAR
jgi:ferredoxin